MGKATIEFARRPHIRSIGLMILGRERPGFDPEWGEQIKTKVIEYVSSDELPFEVPSSPVSTVSTLEMALREMKRKSVDVLIIVQPTMSDGRFAPVLARDWERPLILWATPERQTGEMISSNSLVGTHVFGATLAQLGRTFEFVYGHPDEASTREQLSVSIAACAATTAIRTATVGLIGYHAPGFIDMAAHADAMSRLLNVELYHQSNTEFFSFFSALPDERVQMALKDISKRPIDLTAFSTDEMATAARYYAALQDWIEAYRVNALAIRCWPDHLMISGQWPYLALSLLQTDGYAAVQEGDTDGALSALLAEAAGLGPVYLSDWLEHDRHTCTIWHTGVIPLQFCNGSQPRLANHFNNKRPMVVEGTIPPDIDVTVFRLWHSMGSYHIVAFEGETAEPTRHLLGTNGLVRSADVDLQRWFRAALRLGMPHHVSVVRGHVSDVLERIAYHLNVQWHIIE